MRENAPPTIRPTIQARISVPKCRHAGAVGRNGAKRVTSNGFARQEEAPDEEGFIDKVHMGHLRNTTSAHRAGNPRGLIPWSKGPMRRRVLADKVCASKAPCGSLP